jgi:predicted CXXCH cytochrome family protein
VNESDFGAKFGNSGELGFNWREGAYDESDQLRVGLGLWCIGCHDDVPAYSKPDSPGGIYASNKAGDDSTYGYYATGHGRAPIQGAYSRMSWQATADGGNPPADVFSCMVCHEGLPSEPHIDHVAGTTSRLAAGYENDQSNTNCSQCHPPGGQATAAPDFYTSSGAYETSAHGGTLCTACHEVHGAAGTFSGMTLAEKETLCEQCHAGHAGHALHEQFGIGGNTYSLECTSCHNPHIITGMYSVAASDRSPITRFSSNTSVWGDEPGEKMDDFAGSGRYRTPNGDSLSGSQLPDYPTFCLDCHSVSQAEFGQHGGISWGSDDPHGLNSANIPNGSHAVPDWYSCGKGEGWDLDENINDTWPVLPRGRGELIWTRNPFTQDERIGGANFVLSCSDCHVTHEAGIGGKLRTTVNNGPGTTIWNTMCNNCHYYYSDWHAGMSCGNASCHGNNSRLPGANSIHGMDRRTGASGTRTFNPDLVLDMRFENNLTDSGTWRMHGTWRVTNGGFTSGRFGKAIEVYDDPVEVGTRNEFWSTDAGRHGTWKYSEMKRNMTLEAWVYPTNDSGERKIFAKHTYWNGGYALVLKNFSGSLKVGLLTNVNGGIWGGTDCGGLRGAFSSVPIPLNEWTHVAATYDSALPDRDPSDPTVGRIRIYANGEDVTTSYTDEGSCWAQPGPGEAEMFPFSDHNDAPVGICYEDHWCASALSIGGLNWADSVSNFIGRIDEAKVWNVTKNWQYFGPADSLSPPRIATAQGMPGSDILTISFTEGVWATPAQSGALQPTDFVLTDTDDGRTVTGVTHTGGEPTATLTLSSALDDSSDVGVDVLAPAIGCIYDEYDNVASSTPIAISMQTACPEGIVSLQFNEPAGSPYVLDEQKKLGGSVNDPSESILGDGFFHGDGVDNCIDFSSTGCLRATTELTLEARIKPSMVDDGDGKFIQRVFVKNGSNYQMSVWKNNTWANYQAPDTAASIAFWVRLVDNHGGTNWKPVLTDYTAYPIVANHWYRVKVDWNSAKTGGIPCDIFIDDQGTDGSGANENWAGFVNCTDSDQSQLTDDRKLYEGDEILSADGTLHIGATPNHTLPFNGLIDWITAELHAPLSSPIVLLDFEAAHPSDDVGGAFVTWSTNPGPDVLAGYRLQKRTAAPSPGDQSNDGSVAGQFETTGGSSWITVVQQTNATSYRDHEAGPGTQYRLFGRNEQNEEYLLGQTALPPRPSVRIRTWPSPYQGGSMSISFSTLCGNGAAERVAVEMSIYDAAGRLVRQLVRGKYPPGVHNVTWNGNDSKGRRVADGIYFLRSTGCQQVSVRKLVIVR